MKKTHFMFVPFNKKNGKMSVKTFDQEVLSVNKLTYLIHMFLGLKEWFYTKLFKDAPLNEKHLILQIKGIYEKKI